MKSEPSLKLADHIRKQAFLLVIAVAIAFLYLRTFTLGGIPLVVSQDGPIYFEHGIRILHGQIPFRDYFTYVMPGADLLYAGILLFGVHAWLAQGIVIFLGVTIAGLLFWLSSKILKGPLAFLPALLFLVLDFDFIKDATHHWYGTLIVLAAVGILMEGNTLGRVVSAGALCGLATLFTQSQGVLSLIAIAAYLFWTRDRESCLAVQLALLIAPFTIVVGSVLAYYSCRAGFSSVYFALVTFVFHNFHARPSHTPGAYFLNFPHLKELKNVPHLIPYFFVHILVPFGYVRCLFQLSRDSGTIDRKTRDAMLLINLLGLALFAAVAQAASYNRMSMIAPPASIVCAWLVRGLSVESRIARQALWAIGLFFLAALPFQLQRHWRDYLDLPTGRAAFVDPMEFEEYQWLAQHTRAGESYIGVPSYNFALSLENPTTVDYLIDTNYTTKDQVAAAIRGVQLHKTPTIVLDNSWQTNARYASYPGHGNLTPFIAYVHANYHLAKVFYSPDKDYADEFWQRNSGSAPTHS